MVANDVQVYDSNIPVRDAIAKGEIDIGLINHYYVAEAVAEDPDYPVKVHFPPKDLGSLINVAGIGVLASAGEDEERALKFVRQMLSKQTQTLLRRQLQGVPAGRRRAGAQGAHADRRHPVAERRPRQARRSAGDAQAHAGHRSLVGVTHP